MLPFTVKDATLPIRRGPALVAAGNGSAYAVDPATWSAGLAMSVSMGGRGPLGILLVDGGGTATRFSKDGISWQAGTLPASLAGGLIDIAVGDSLCILATSLSFYFTSPDGINWTQQASALKFKAVAYDYKNRRFIGALFSGGAPYWSTDGINWTIATTYTAQNVASARCIAYMDGAMYSLTQDTYQAWTAKSIDGGVTWTACGTINTTCNRLVAANGVLVATSRTANTVRLSTDGGATWSAGAVLPTTPADGYVIPYAGGLAYFDNNGTGNLYRSLTPGGAWSGPITLPSINYSLIA